MKVRKLRYHQPGWIVEADDIESMVWAPNSTRADWQSCWERRDETAGNFAHAETLEAVLAILPRQHAIALRQAIEAEVAL